MLRLAHRICLSPKKRQKWNNALNTWALFFLVLTINARSTNQSCINVLYFPQQKFLVRIQAIELIFEIGVFFGLNLRSINVVLQYLPILEQKQGQSNLNWNLKVGTYSCMSKCVLEVCLGHLASKMSLAPNCRFFCKLINFETVGPP